MKRLTVYLVLAALVGVLIIYTQNEKPETKEIQDISNPPENNMSRAQWEFDRHKDPRTGLIPDDIKFREALFVSKLPGASFNIKEKSNSILSQDWQRRGPAEVGGRTRALAIDIMDENIILAGGVSGGMWRSTNGGQSWNKTTTPMQLHSVSCITQDTRIGKENNWYYGTGEFYGNSAGISGDGIYKSTDGGKTWNPILSTSSFIPQSWENRFDYIWRIVINHKNTQQDEIYVATALGGIFRSTDGGDSWSVVLGGYGNTFSYFTELMITPSGVLYATLSQYSYSVNSQVKGIYRSIDGIKWTNITPQDMPAKYRRIIPAFAPSDENIVYFAAETPGSGKLTTNSMGDSLWHSFWKYTYVSGDGSGSGGIWENRTDNIPKPNLVRHHFNTQGSYNFTMKVKPDDPETVIIGAVNLYRTTDGLKTNNNTTIIGGTCPESGSMSDCEYFYRYPNHHADQHEILFSKSNPNVIYTGSDGGVHKTLNVLAKEVEWISLNNSYFTTQFYTCAVDHTAVNDEIIGGLQDNGTLFSRWNDLGKSWTTPGNGDGFHCSIADNGEYYYASQNSSYQPKIKIFRNKLDKSGAVISKTRIDPVGGESFIWNTPFVLDPNNNNIMYLCGGRLLWRNSDLSKIPEGNAIDSTSVGWDSINVHTSLLFANEFMSAVEVSKNQANVVYYGTTKGKLFKITESNSSNYKFTNVTGKNFPSNGYVSSIAIDPLDAEKVFVTFSNYNVLSIFYSANGGTDWIPVSGNLEANESGSGSGPAVHHLEIVPVNEKNLLFAATSAGLFSTAYIDGKFTVWQMEGPESIGNMVINMIDSRDEDDFVAVATHGTGMFFTRINGLPSAPGKPELVSPADNTKGILKSVELTWKAVPGAYYYKLQISSNPDFSDFITEFDGIDTTSFVLNDVEQGLKDCYWRVFAKSSGGISSPSESRKFTSAISPPLLLSPENKENGVQIPVTLQWQPVENATGYNVILSGNLAFTNLIMDTSGIKDSQLQVGKLEKGKKYYWKVASYNQDGTGLYSSYYTFTTEPPNSVREMYDQNNFIRIYPNPVVNFAKIEINIDEPGNVKIEVMDLCGKLVKSNLITDEFKSNMFYNLDASQLKAGTYFIIAESFNKKYVKKFVVEK